MICDINSYYDYLTINYNKLKEKIKRILFLEDIKFDEDIFHTTLYNCHALFANNNMTFSSEINLESYLYSSMKLNIFRNKHYAVNKYKFVDIEENEIQDTSDISCIHDFNLIHNSIESEFGLILTLAYYDNVGGESISSLQKEVNIKNLKNKIKKKKKYINDKNRDSFI